MSWSLKSPQWYQHLSITQDISSHCLLLLPEIAAPVSATSSQLLLTEGCTQCCLLKQHPAGQEGCVR